MTLVTSPTTPCTDATAPTALAQADVEMLVLLAQGDDKHKARQALEMLVKRHQKMVYAMLYHLAPERDDLADLTQEVLLRVCRSIHSLRNPKTFKLWLNRIVTNLFYDQLRKKSRQLSVISVDEPQYDDNAGASPTRDIMDPGAQPHQTLLQHELDDKIRQAIVTLPEHFRTVVVLRELQGLSYEEIAALTNTQLGTVKSRLARARERLQAELKPYL